VTHESGIPDNANRGSVAIPYSALAAGGVYHYKDGRTAPDTINVLLQYPGPNEFTATFEATLVPGIRAEAIEMCGSEGRLWIDCSRYEWYPVGSKTPEEVVKAEVLPNSRDSLHAGSRGQLSAMCKDARAPEW
jgi:hypothetical protein